jgi:hypothetical protein
MVFPLQAAPGGTRPSVQWLLDAPIALGENEFFQAEMDFSSVSTGDDVVTSQVLYAWVLVWLADQWEPVPSGEILWFSYQHVIRYRDIPDDAAAWLPLDLNLGDIPPGKYVMIGSAYNSTAAWARPLAVRWNFPRSPFRPASLGVFLLPDEAMAAQIAEAYVHDLDADAAKNILSSLERTAMFGRSNDAFYQNVLGVWGTFVSSSPPVPEFLFAPSTNALDIPEFTPAPDSSAVLLGSVGIIRIGD